MAIKTFDAAAINLQDETFIRGKPSEMPFLRKDQKLVAHVSPDKSTRSIPLIVETIEDAQKIYAQYYVNIQARIIWKKAELNDRLAEAKEVNDISKIF